MSGETDYSKLGSFYKNILNGDYKKSEETISDELKRILNLSETKEDDYKFKKYDPYKEDK